MVELIFRQYKRVTIIIQNFKEYNSYNIPTNKIIALHYLNNKFFSTKFSLLNSIKTKRFWNNFHLVRSKSKDWIDK